MLDSAHDVLILGGGLSGLTLALQLKQTMPDLDVRVLERRSGPAPLAAHKVGESSVEIGAHYFSETLGLRGHLDSAHLRKFGFRFFFSEGRHDLSSVTELGASRYLSTPSWQIDRGIFENHLADEATRQGVRVDAGAVVRRIDLNPQDPVDGPGHRVEAEWLGENGTPRRETIRARWVLDASGRASLLKRKLDLAQDNGHHANAVWFRLNTRLDVDNWVDDSQWRGRCDPAARWMSTNHLCGAGYWLWLIPLSCGAHSVGIVADADMHPLDGLNTFDKAMAWIAEHQPCLHEVLDGQRDTLMDFAFFRDFSYGCKQVFSAERWAITGDAGMFLDPFYSPGSDFIAISNTYITKLVQHDRAGESLRMPSLFYGEVMQSFYQSTLSLYEGQYALFGSPRVMPTKVLWDYTYYWGVLCQLFFQDRLADRAALLELHEPLMRARQLNEAMQALLRQWGECTDLALAKDGSRDDNPARMLDQASLPWFAELNAGLRDKLTDAEFRQRMRTNVAQLEALASEIVGQALRDVPDLDLSALPIGLAPVDSTDLLFQMAA
ncbi:MAG: tryptophan 7-halogenase [Burkholderiales bacterium]|nr:tryptophan 7-halogenase [Burkholderiales bacterium]